MPDESVSEYRLSQVEKAQSEFRKETKDALEALGKKLDELPDKLEAKYATKNEVRDVDARVDGLVEDQKTKKTTTRAWTIPIVGVVLSVVLTGLVAFCVYAIQTLNYVNTLRGQ